MAEIEYTRQGAPEPGVNPEAGVISIGAMVNVAGALVSLALVAGVGIWGYKLLVRDVSGVPVVRALKGEMRLPPEKPGGLPADHQGLAVNAVAANGVAAPPADELKLAPPPVDLSDEDTPVPPNAADRTAAAKDPAAPPSGDALTAFREGSVEALVEELTRGVAPLEGGTDGEGDDAILQPAALDPSDEVAEAPSTGPELMIEKTQEEIAIDPTDLALLAAPGVKRSLRPIARPAELEQTARADQADVQAAIDNAVDTSTPGATDIDPDSLPAGTRLAQLGAYDSPDLARTEWDKINARFEDYMEGKGRVIQQAASGGRTFYRLRAMGFDDLSDARRFCSALVAGGADCIPVTTR